MPQYRYWDAELSASCVEEICSVVRLALRWALVLGDRVWCYTSSQLSRWPRQPLARPRPMVIWGTLRFRIQVEGFLWCCLNILVVLSTPPAGPKTLADGTPAILSRSLGARKFAGVAIAPNPANSSGQTDCRSALLSTSGVFEPKKCPPLNFCIWSMHIIPARSGQGMS